MEKELEKRNLEIEKELKSDLENIITPNDLVQVKAKYLGKTGLVSDLTKNMRDLESSERALVGKYATEIRNKVNDLLIEADTKLKEEILSKKLKEETIDITLPSKKIRRSRSHTFN